MIRLLRVISAQYLRSASGRTLLVTGGVAVGVALIAAINIINESVLADFRRTIETLAGPADLQVTLGTGEIGFPEHLEQVVHDHPDVAVAVPLSRGTVAVTKNPSQILHLFGADLVAEENLKRYQITLATERDEAEGALIDPLSIFLTSRLATRLSIGVGDSIRLSTPTGNRDLTIRGLLQTEGFASAFGGDIAVMDIAAAQDLLDKRGRVDRIDIVLDKGTDVPQVRSQLELSLPDVLTVQPPQNRGLQYDRVLSSFQAMLTGLSSLCLITGLFIIYNTTSTAAIQRATPMAHLRLVGADSRQILTLLSSEALFLGALGSIVGVAISIPLAWLLAGTITSSMGVIFQLRFPFEELHLDPWKLLAIAVAGTCASLFASSFAAYRIAKSDPLDMIRDGKVAADGHPRSLPLVALWLMLMTSSALCFVLEDLYKSIAWGNFGSTLWNASVVVVAVPLMRFLARPLSRALTKTFGAEGQVAAGSLSRAETRSGVTVAAIALILTVAVLLSSLVLSCRESLSSYFSGFLASDLTVSAVTTEGGWLETPLSGDLAGQLQAIPGVKQVDMARALPGHRYGNDRIALLGLSSPLFDPARAPAGWYREGDAVSAAGPLQSGRAVLVSSSFADRFDIHVDDSVNLDSPTGRLTFPVVGVVPDYVSDRGSVIMNKDILTEHWQDARANRFMVSVQDSILISSVRSNIRQQLGRRYQLKILSTGELLQYHTEKIDSAFAVMNSVQLLIIIVTVAGVFDLLLSRIIERRRELAIWRLVGAGKSSVRRAVMLESATIGLVGAMLGVAVGIVTSWVWVAIHFRELLGYYVEFHFATASMLWYVGLAVSMTMLAGYGAATRAMQDSVLDGIRDE